MNAASIVLSDGARPPRFVFTGGMAGLTQLSLLYLLTSQGPNAILAKASAFLPATQLNFYLSQVFAWHDRRPSGLAKNVLLIRWFSGLA